MGDPERIIRNAWSNVRTWPADLPVLRAATNPPVPAFLSEAPIDLVMHVAEFRRERMISSDMSHYRHRIYGKYGDTEVVVDERVEPAAVRRDY